MKQDEKSEEKTMTETVKTLLSHEGIRLCAPIALSELKILRPYLLEKTA